MSYDGRHHLHRREEELPHVPVLASRGVRLQRGAGQPDVVRQDDGGAPADLALRQLVQQRRQDQDRSGRHGHHLRRARRPLAGHGWCVVRTVRRLQCGGYRPEGGGLAESPRRQRWPPDGTPADRVSAPASSGAAVSDQSGVLPPAMTNSGSGPVYGMRAARCLSVMSAWDTGSRRGSGEARYIIDI